MITFLKGILKGLLYVLFFPFGVVAICIYGVFGIFVFIYRIFKLAYLFFTGRNLKNELDEDEQVRKILEDNKPEENEEEQKPEEPALSLYPSDSEMYKTEYISPTFEDKEKELEEENIEEEAEHE